MIENKKFLYHFDALAVAIITLLISGCAVQRINEVQSDAKDNEIKTSSLIKQMGDNNPVVNFTNSQYVNPNPLPKLKYEAPAKLVNCTVVYKTAQAQDIFQFSQDMSEQCRYRFRVTPDAASYLSVGAGSGLQGNATQRLSSVPSPVISSAMQPLASFGSGVGQDAGSVIAASSGNTKISNVSYSGPLGALLDQVVGRLGISWKYQDDMVVFYYLETRRFDIQPTDASYTLTGSVTSGLSNATGSGTGSSDSSSSGVSGSGGSMMNSTVKMGNNLYEDLNKTVTSMLTPGVGRISLNQTTGTFMVTDVPEVVSRIGEYLTAENCIFAS